MIKELSKGTAEPLVLRILTDGPLHGYGILQAIKERSGDVLEFTEGTIYPLLHTLEHEQLVSATWETVPSGRRRKVYCITAAGRMRLTEALGEWQRFRAGVDSVFSRGAVPSV